MPQFAPEFSQADFSQTAWVAERHGEGIAR
jgi:hypothetical protein